MRDLADFLHHAAPFVIGAPEPVVVQYLRTACQDWCKRTRAWREVDTFTTTGMCFEPIAVPGYASLFEIEAAWFNSCRLEPLSFTDGVEMLGKDGEPRFFSQPQPNMLSLHPAGVGHLRLSMFFKPAEDAEVVPDFLYDQHASDIAAGAVGMLKLLPGQPFTDPNMAQVFLDRFNAAADAHFASNLRGQQRAHLRTKSRFF